MKRLLAALPVFALTACGGAGVSPAETVTVTAESPLSMTPEDISFRHTGMVDSDPDMATVSCESKVVAVDGVSYTLKGGTWSEKLDGAFDLSAAIAPESPNASTVEVFAYFDNATTVNVIEPPALAGANAVAIRGGDELPYKLPVSMSLHTTGTEISTEMLADVGSPIRISASLNGQSLGECSY